MAWNTGTSYGSSDPITAALLNGIGNDLRTPGGNVDYGGTNSAVNLASTTYASGGSLDGSTILLKSTGQAVASFWNSGGMSTKKRAALLYDGGLAVTGGGFVFQALDDSGGFVANLVSIIRTGLVGIGTITPTVSGSGLLHCGGDTVRLFPISRTPANSAATGNDGEMCADSSFVYVHTGGSWRRAALSTF